MWLCYAFPKGTSSFWFFPETFLHQFSVLLWTSSNPVKRQKLRFFKENQLYTNCFRWVLTGKERLLPLANTKYISHISATNGFVLAELIIYMWNQPLYTICSIRTCTCSIATLTFLIVTKTDFLTLFFILRGHDSIVFNWNALKIET